MGLSKITEKISEESRAEIKKHLELDKQYTSQFTSHKVSSLKVLFNEWHKLFPQQKQDMNCSGCRKAVIKFFTVLTDEWSKE